MDYIMSTIVWNSVPQKRKCRYTAAIFLWSSTAIHVTVSQWQERQKVSSNTSTHTSNTTVTQGRLILSLTH